MKEMLGIVGSPRRNGNTHELGQRLAIEGRARSKLTGDPAIEIWGDGEQTRSFCYIDDCVRGTHMLMRSDYRAPLNLGQDRLISINVLADLIAGIAVISVIKKHVAGPQGVRGRNSHNTRLRQVLGWEPVIPLEEGLRRTYAWIEQQYFDRKAGKRVVEETW